MGKLDDFIVADPIDLTELKLEDSSGVVDEKEEKRRRRKKKENKERKECYTSEKLEERATLVKVFEETTVLMNGHKD